MPGCEGLKASAAPGVLACGEAPARGLTREGLCRAGPHRMHGPELRGVCKAGLAVRVAVLLKLMAGLREAAGGIAPFLGLGSRCTSGVHKPLPGGSGLPLSYVLPHQAGNTPAHTLQARRALGGTGAGLAVAPSTGPHMRGRWSGTGGARAIDQQTPQQSPPGRWVWPTI